MDGAYGVRPEPDQLLAAVSEAATSDPAAAIRVAQDRLRRAAAKAGLENDPLGDCFDALSDCLGAMGDLRASMKADVARGLTPEGEEELVRRITREVRIGLAAMPRAQLLRTSLLGAGVVLGAMALAGAVAYAVGHSKGGESRVTELCQGPAVQAQKGGTSCSFWLVPPTGAERR